MSGCRSRCWWASVPGSTPAVWRSCHRDSPIPANGDGQVSVAYRYDSCGNPLVGANSSGPAFTGREWDAETGLHYYRARYYYPGIGTFISEDPLGSNGGVNVYAYARNNPLRFSDPFGIVDKLLINGLIEGSLIKKVKQNGFELSKAAARALREEMTEVEFGDLNDKLKVPDARKLEILQDIGRRILEDRTRPESIKRELETLREKLKLLPSSPTQQGCL